MTATVQSDGAWSVTPTSQLGNGTYTAQAEQDDLVGDSGLSAATTFRLSTPPPIKLTINALGSKPLITSTPTLSGTAGIAPGDSPVLVTIYSGPSASGSAVRTLSAPVSDAGTWLAQITPALADGRYTAIAAQFVVGEMSQVSSSVTFTIDALVGTGQLSIEQPGAGVTVQQSALRFGGSASTAPGAAGTVTVTLWKGEAANGKPLGTVTAASNGSTWATMWGHPLALGYYTVQASQATTAGTVRTSTDTFLLTPMPEVIGGIVSLSRGRVASVAITCNAPAGEVCTGTVLVATAGDLPADPGRSDGPGQTDLRVRVDPRRSDRHGAAGRERAGLASAPSPLEREADREGSRVQRYADAEVVQVIARYTRPELAEIWSDHAHFEAMREVEVAACEEMDGPTPAELDAIRAASFTVEAITEREKVTDHDTAAFVDVLVGLGRSRRTLDPPRADLERRARHRSRAPAAPRRARSCFPTPAARRRARRRAPANTCTRCAPGGRTGSTPSRRRSGSSSRASRSRRTGTRERLERAFDQASVGAISGAVGTYSATSPEFEERVLDAARPRARAGLDAGRRARPPRRAAAGDRAGRRRARAASRPSSATSRAPRSARYASRSAGGQKGSSSMPHKRNPIKSEQVVGLARVLRGNALAALEDVALWHERDISHSSVERIILPDSTILLDHMQRRALGLVEGMVVDAERMRENLELTHGALFSQRVLLALVATGLSRDDAYRDRPAARPAGARQSACTLRELLAADPAGAGARPRRDLRLRARSSATRDEIVARLDAIVSSASSAAG